MKQYAVNYLNYLTEPEDEYSGNASALKAAGRENEGILKGNILDLIKDASSKAALQKEHDEKHAEKAIVSFFEYGKLKTIPALLRKRLIVISGILKKFVIGRKYTVKEVDLITENFHDDFCTLLRESAQRR